MLAAGEKSPQSFGVKKSVLIIVVVKAEGIWFVFYSKSLK
jgi:hypothetical protein